MFKQFTPQFKITFDQDHSPHPVHEYKPKYIEVTGIQLRMPITYELWGDTQKAKAGDWLVEKGTDTYTIEEQEFSGSYSPVSGTIARYYKSEHIEAVEARVGGWVDTLEGRSCFEAGDFIACSPTGKTWCLKAKKLFDYYELV